MTNKTHKEQKLDNAADAVAYLIKKSLETNKDFLLNEAEGDYRALATAIIVALQRLSVELYATSSMGHGDQTFLSLSSKSMEQDLSDFRKELASKEH